ncbi:MAG: ParB-like protein [Pseudomonadota bacterium]|jgi:hypothetical protein
MTLREPRLTPTPIRDLRPTQITVGLREVHEKRRRWREESASQGAEFLGRHMVPVVLGPKGRPYVLDHHHLVRALHEEGVEDVLTTVVADFRHLSRESFWVCADMRGFCHPYDAAGRRQDFDAIPKSIAKLVDDPYRSLAGELRRAGGFAKDTTPFSEFQWAEHMRSRIKLKALDEDFEAALKRALALAKRQEASYLPGWCGPLPPA